MKRFLCFVAACALALPASAQQMVNFRDADIRAFIQDVSRATGRTFIVDPRVTGKVTVVTERPLSRSEYFEVFLSTLRANGLVAVPTAGGAFRIQPSDTIAAQPSVLASPGSGNRFVTEVIRLRSIDPASAVSALQPLISQQGKITPNPGGNSIVVADYADNMRRIRGLLSQIDRDRSATRLIELENAGPREIAESLTALASPGGQGTPTVSIVPIDSSNSVALRGDAADVERFAQLARDLDRRAASGTEIRVVFLEHADAAQLLPVLQNLLGQPVTAAPAQDRSTRGFSTDNQSGNTRQQGQPAPVQQASATTGAAPAAVPGLFGNKPVVVTRFEGANAIVIAAPLEVQRQLGEVIRQLDQRRQQVLVEAIIVEISGTAAKRLGVQLLLAGLEGSNIPFAVTNYSNASPNILTIAGAVAAEELRTETTTVNGQVVTTSRSSPIADTLQEAAAQELLGSAGGLFGAGFRAGNAIFGAIVNAVEQDANSNLLATPSVTVIDNQPARFLAGQEVPVTTGEALSDNFDNAFRTVQRQNVGISLEVVPQINAGDTIKLDIRQEVSSVAGTVGNRQSADLILNKREIETSIVVDDGDIIGIGGLLNDNERDTLERIPLLSDIPLLGELFKSRSRQREKTNLMIFIRPTILRSAAEARAMTERRYGYVRQQQFLQSPDAEPSIDQLVREYMGIEPPQSPPPPPPPVLVVPQQQTTTTTVRPVEVPPSEVEEQ